MKVSLVIPAFNEEQRLVPFLESILKFKQRHPSDIYEVLVIDDGSTDATIDKVQNFKLRFPALKLLRHQTNRGKGAAVQTGVLAAKGDYVVFTDADGATPIAELTKMIESLRLTPVAVGNRWMKGAKTERHSFLRTLSGWVYRTYMKLFGLGAIDTMCGFKGYRADVAKSIFKDLQEPRWLFDMEVAYKVVQKNIPVTNFPIRWESKQGSKLSTFTLLKTSFEIWPLIRRIKIATR